MKPNQPDKPENENITDEPTTEASRLEQDTPPKEVVDKVVNKLNKMGVLDEDPNKTWTTPNKDKQKPELDLTLTEEDEADYSTQPIPSDLLVESELAENTSDDGPSMSTQPIPSDLLIESELADQTPDVVKSNLTTQEITVSAKLIAGDEANTLARTSNSPPWTLQQFFNGEIDLDVELARRFPTMPMMSIIKTRTLGTHAGRKVAEMSSQDGAATMIIDADTVSKVIQMSFTFGSMITLKFIMRDLNNMDRDRWLDLMRREAGGLAFLWGTKRWTSDYMICISRKHFTNLYAFSPSNFEAGVRLTPKITDELLDWLETIWDEPEPDDEPPQLLTW